MPSLSVTLSGLTTRTVVRFDLGLPEDRVVLGGADAGDPRARRWVELLDRVRRASGEARRAEVSSTNDFPAASGPRLERVGLLALALAAPSARRGSTGTPPR